MWTEHWLTHDSTTWPLKTLKHDDMAQQFLNRQAESYYRLNRPYDAAMLMMQMIETISAWNSDQWPLLGADGRI